MDGKRSRMRRQMEGDHAIACRGSGLVLRNEASIECGDRHSLRNEATGAFLLQFGQCTESFVERAVVSGLIAQKEGESLFIARAIREDTFRLKTQSALGEPARLSHFADEDFFGCGLGPVFVQEVIEQSFKGSRIFAVDEKFAGGKTVFERVTGRDALTFEGARAGGVLGDCPIDGDAIRYGLIRFGFASEFRGGALGGAAFATGLTRSYVRLHCNHTVRPHGVRRNGRRLVSGSRRAGKKSGAIVTDSG